MRKKIFYKKTVAFFAGIWMALLITQPASAQWTVHINSDTSPTTFQMIQQMAQQLVAQTSIAADAKTSRLQQALEYIKTGQRWIETVEHYTTQIIGDIRRFTSLKGILTTVEKQLGLSDDTLKALKDIGDIIRGAFTLKNSFLSLIRTRLAMIESLEQRARQGIFNPEADLRDLEDYLKNSVGRSAGATLATRQKLAESDPFIERLTYEIQKVRAGRAAIEKELSGINEQLGRESNLQTRPRTATTDADGASTTVFDNTRQSMSPEAVQTLTLRAGQLEAQIADLVIREQVLTDQLQERYQELQKNYSSAYLKGRYWQSVLQGWDRFDQVKRRELENMIDTQGATTR